MWNMWCNILMGNERLQTSKAHKAQEQIFKLIPVKRFSEIVGVNPPSLRKGIIHLMPILTEEEKKIFLERTGYKL